MSLQLDINGALLLADNVGFRAAKRAAAKYRARCQNENLRDCDAWADFEASLTKSVKMSYEAGVREFNRVTGAQMAFSPRAAMRGLAKYQRRAINALYASIARSATDSTMAKTRNALLSAIARMIEEDPAEYQRKVAKALKAHKSQLDTVVVTQNSVAFNAAIWHEAEDDDELWGWEYSTAGDERVRPTHEAMEGVRYPKNHIFWRRYFPPNGWRCRCTANPIYKNTAEAFTLPFFGTPQVPPEFRFNAGKVFSKMVKRGILV